METQTSNLKPKGVIMDQIKPESAAVISALLGSTKGVSGRRIDQMLKRFFRSTGYWDMLNMGIREKGRRSA